MEQFSARAFFTAGMLIECIQSECLVASTMVDPDTPLYNLAATLDDRAKNKAIEYLEPIEKVLRTVGLSLSADSAKDARESIEQHGNDLNYQWLRDHLNGLRKLIEREMKNHAFFYISPERSKFWPKVDQRSLFGDAVADSFPLAYFDSSQAGICLAIGLGSATVFHLMRVVEIGLSSLGGKLGVSLAHTNWHPAIEEIEKKIRNLHVDPAWKNIPDIKDLQEKYAQTASHFGIIKDAWRNYTMHARGKYTEDEAELLFNNVKGLMQKLADLGLKEAP